MTTLTSSLAISPSIARFTVSMEQRNGLPCGRFCPTWSVDELWISDAVLAGSADGPTNTEQDRCLPSMLERARAETASPTVDYQCTDLDLLNLGPGSTDIVFSSLTLHYVRDLSRLLSMAAESMTPGGCMVFSVEHPIYSAPTTQEFETSQTGRRIWPLDNYLVEGERVTNWFVDGVLKEHRTVATYVNTVIEAGLVLDQIVEWGPSADAVAARPELADDRHRPWFLLLRATKPSDS